MFKGIFFHLLLTFLFVANETYAQSSTTYDFCGVQVVDENNLTSEQKSKLSECYDKNKSNQKSFWIKNLARKFEDRIVEAPTEVLSAIKIDNILYGYTGDPRVPQQKYKHLVKMSRDILRKLPVKYKSLLNEKFLGLMFIEGLGSTGFSPYTFLAGNEISGGFIVLDVDYLKMSTNERNTYRENTLFDLSNSKLTVDLVLADNKDDNIYNSLQEIIIHELGHTLTYGSTIVPIQNRPVVEFSENVYSFYPKHWIARGGGSELTDILKPLIPFQKQLKYYRKVPPMKATDVLPVYSALAQSCFATTYGMRSPEEDFVESLTHYIRTFMLNKQQPFAAIVSDDSQVVLKVDSVWNRGNQCDYVKSYFDQMFQD